MPHKFDDANKRILALTKQDFFEGNEETRLRHYLHALENLRSASLRNSIHILETCSWAMLNLYRAQYPVISKSPYPKEGENIPDRTMLVSPYLIRNRIHIDMDSNALCKFISKFIQDTVVQLATAGSIEYKQEHFEKALHFFKAAADRQPDFGEVHWYLCAVFNKLNMKDQADQQQQMAEKLSVSPFIDQ